MERRSSFHFPRSMMEGGWGRGDKAREGWVEMTENWSAMVGNKRPSPRPSFAPLRHFHSHRHMPKVATLLLISSSPTTTTTTTTAATTTMTPHSIAYPGPIQPIPSSTGPLLFRPATWMIQSSLGRSNPWTSPFPHDSKDPGRMYEYSSGKATQVYGDMSFCPSKSGRERGRGRGRERGRLTEKRPIDQRTAGSREEWEERRTATNEVDVLGMEAPIHPTPTLPPAISFPLNTSMQSEHKPRRPVRSSSTLAPELVSPRSNSNRQRVLPLGTDGDRCTRGQTVPSLQTGPILMSGFPPLCTSPSPLFSPLPPSVPSRKNKNKNKKKEDESGTWVGEGTIPVELDVSKLGLEDDLPSSPDDGQDGFTGFTGFTVKVEQQQQEGEEEEERERESDILNPIARIRRSTSQTTTPTQNVTPQWHEPSHHPQPLPLRSYHTSPLPSTLTSTSKKGTKGRSRPYEHLSEMYTYSRVPRVGVSGEGQGGRDLTEAGPGPGPGLGLGLGRDDEGLRGTKDRLKSKLIGERGRSWGRGHKVSRTPSCPSIFLVKPNQTELN
jgi:hypothetical protein